MQQRKEGVELTVAQEQYLLPQFFALVVGKPGSGKSHVVKELATSKDFYGGKFNKTLVVSPSVAKLGIPVSKENKCTSYNLQWIMAQIMKVNNAQILRIQQTLKSKSSGTKGKIPYLPQSVIDASFNKDIRQQGSSATVPPEYLSFNKNQRFFSVEILAVMNQGYNKMVGSNYATSVPHMATGKMETSSTGDSLMKGVCKKKRLIKEEAKKAGEPIQFGAMGQYKDVDEVERLLVQKLTPQQQAQTRFNLLLILDDVIGGIKAHENDEVQAQLFFNRRHLIANGTISIILVSQKYTMIPARLRSQASQLIIFRLNPLDLENVYKDVIMMAPAKWNQLLDQVFQISKDSGDKQTMASKKYDHLDIWVEYDMFFKNFKKLTLNNNLT